MWTNCRRSLLKCSKPWCLYCYTNLFTSLLNIWAILTTSRFSFDTLFTHFTFPNPVPVDDKTNDSESSRFENEGGAATAARHIKGCANLITDFPFRMAIASRFENLPTFLQRSACSLSIHETNKQNYVRVTRCQVTLNLATRICSPSKPFHPPINPPSIRI